MLQWLQISRVIGPVNMTNATTAVVATVKCLGAVGLFSTAMAATGTKPYEDGLIQHLLNIPQPEVYPH